MMTMFRRFAGTLCVLLSLPAVAGDWTGWRGPNQDGTSTETGLVLKPDAAAPLWSVPIGAAGTPVVVGDRVYLWGFEGEGVDLAEVLVALDASSGGVLWKRSFRDFLSDIIYERYAIGSPTVDPVTGNVYLLTSPGRLLALSPAGETLWEVPLMDAWGRLTFPNGRTGGPLLDGDLVIVHHITSSWGALGPARDRFNAFDKRTGEAVWVSTPGIAPKDNSFSTAVSDLRGGRRLLYAGTGCGNVVAIDARTGEPVWRFPASSGGVNASPVLFGDLLVVTHDKENLDSTTVGRTVAIDVSKAPGPAEDGGTPVLRSEVWRNGLSGGTSSPVVVGDLVYQVTVTGELTAFELKTGVVLWAIKLGPDQLHASPVWAEGHLYVPMSDGNLHVVKVGREGGQIVHSTKLDGFANGAPAIANGRVYVTTTRRLYAFGAVRAAEPTPVAKVDEGAPGPATQLRVRPVEVLLRPGESVRLTADVLDAQGRLIKQVPVEAAEKFVPPTAKVKSEMDASFVGGALVAAPTASLSAGAWKVKAAGLEGVVRGRTVVGVPFAEDFDGLTLTDRDAAGASYAFPPLPWIGARFKWEVRERDGSLVLAKTLDNLLFQRSVVFLGHPTESGYTLQADVMSDGDRRQIGAVGVVNQRYVIALKGNQKRLEVSSNQERLREGVPFEMQPGVWYRLKTEVRVDAAGVGTIRAKAWPRDQAEPAAWTLVVTHAAAHTEGAPGLFGFTPQNRDKVYIDAVSLTRTDEASP
jgi:outer membrane protein assembly factor BamB